MIPVVVDSNALLFTADRTAVKETESPDLAVLRDVVSALTGNISGLLSTLQKPTPTVRPPPTPGGEFSILYFFPPNASASGFTSIG